MRLWITKWTFNKIWQDVSTFSQSQSYCHFLWPNMSKMRLISAKCHMWRNQAEWVESLNQIKRLKPVTCRYWLPTHPTWSQHIYSIQMKLNLFYSNDYEPINLNKLDRLLLETVQNLKRNVVVHFLFKYMRINPRLTETLFVTQLTKGVGGWWFPPAQWDFQNETSYDAYFGTSG